MKLYEAKRILKKAGFICEDTQQKKIVARDRDHLFKLIKDHIREHGPKCDLNHIDVSNIENMNYLFYRTDFNGDISQWDVSNVTDMNGTFRDSNFNGDISQWDVSNVRFMNGLFYQSNFNGDISQWDVSNIESMEGIFKDSNFTGDISNWLPMLIENGINIDDLGIEKSKLFKNEKSRKLANKVAYMDAPDYNKKDLKKLDSLFKSFCRDLGKYLGIKFTHKGTVGESPEYAYALGSVKNKYTNKSWQVKIVLEWEKPWGPPLESHTIWMYTSYGDEEIYDYRCPGIDYGREEFSYYIDALQEEIDKYTKR